MSESKEEQVHVRVKDLPGNESAAFLLKSKLAVVEIPRKWR
jgi:hypothetical protein